MDVASGYRTVPLTDYHQDPMPLADSTPNEPQIGCPHFGYALPSLRALHRLYSQRSICEWVSLPSSTSPFSIDLQSRSSPAVSMLIVDAMLLSLPDTARNRPVDHISCIYCSSRMSNMGTRVETAMPARPPPFPIHQLLSSWISTAGQFMRFE
ncbi:uncharacterized protein BO97DRAFT_92292 [Aspergillus homomorphus CBS 101889]|uniref:Uncharacterized protein n=1 Tax=Aspergillus homomorphus (strain CBS 101889) TaxID=1450537 RepID=A0A395HW62_ASPHC|nr:hypothetical protein BO97DRAFT_92292 [Aspergillus homomorphus CBS 101889]RAL11655.1 hypothetical protein BO97DRAFT_92292 [Aspergillus homomorphus CBS 101889]